MFVLISKNKEAVEDNNNKIQTFYWEQSILGYGYKEDEHFEQKKKHSINI